MHWLQAHWFLIPLAKRAVENIKDFPLGINSCWTKWSVIFSSPNIAFNSLMPSDAYMPTQTVPSLVQIMACRLFGDNSLSEPMMVYSKMDPKEHLWMNYIWKSEVFIKKKSFEDVVCKKWGPSCLDPNVLIRHGVLCFQRLPLQLR